MTSTSPPPLDHGGELHVVGSLPRSGISAFASALVVCAPTSTASAAGPAEDDWLGIVNIYRTQSGLAPIANNSAWSNGARNHSCWMLLNGIAHDEAPGTPGYTADGDQAGNSGNVAVSSSSTATAAPPHRSVDVRPVPRDRAPSAIAAAGRVRDVRQPSQSVHDAVEVSGHPRRHPRKQLGRRQTDEPCRVPRQWRHDEPHSFRRRVTRSTQLLRLGVPECRAPADRHDAVERHDSNGDARRPWRRRCRHACCTSRTRPARRARSSVATTQSWSYPRPRWLTGSYTVAVTSNGGTANWSFNVDPSAPLGVTEPHAQHVQDARSRQRRSSR